MRHRFTAGLLTVCLGVGLVALGAPNADAGSKARAKKKHGRQHQYGSDYRVNSANGGFQFPVGYGGNGGSQYQNGGQYQNGSSQYQNGGQYQYGGSQYRRRAPREQPYTRGDNRPYVTDEWGNRRYYDPRYGDGFNRYDGSRYRRAGYRSRYDVDTEASQNSQNGSVYCPPGHSRGRKTGWRRR
jgi:hypothetical protein